MNIRYPIYEGVYRILTGLPPYGSLFYFPTLYYTRTCVRKKGLRLLRLHLRLRHSLIMPSSSKLT